MPKALVHNHIMVRMGPPSVIRPCKERAAAHCSFDCSVYCPLRHVCTARSSLTLSPADCSLLWFYFLLDPPCSAWTGARHKMRRLACGLSVKSWSGGLRLLPGWMAGKLHYFYFLFFHCVDCFVQSHKEEICLVDCNPFRYRVADILITG